MLQALFGLSPREQIIKLRRERFQIDEEGKLLGPVNPLAGAADGMGEIVATHMYSTVGRFMCEYLQNVGDNAYADGYVLWRGHICVIFSLGCLCCIGFVVFLGSEQLLMPCAKRCSRSRTRNGGNRGHRTCRA